MTVLIIESVLELARLWQAHIERMGFRVLLATSEGEALRILYNTKINLIIMDVALAEGYSLTVSDYAQYRHPTVPVLFVTRSTFFSDGSIFQHAANACAIVPSGTPPTDLAALVEHYATEGSSPSSPPDHGGPSSQSQD